MLEPDPARLRSIIRQKANKIKELQQQITAYQNQIKDLEDLNTKEIEDRKKEIENLKKEEYVFSREIDELKNEIYGS
jgi:predicted RNase H-like nuclease (RuvC/YqgF family)